MKRAIVIVCVLVMSLFTLSACGDKGDWDYIEKKGEIIIGYDNHFAPMGFVQEGQDVGFDIDLANSMKDILGVKVKLIAINWGNKEIELKGKKIDLIWNGFTITPKREKNILFSIPYLKNDQVMVVKKSDEATYTNAESLKGKKLVGQLGSSAKDAILGNGFLKQYGKYVELENNVNVLDELKKGLHDAAVLDSVVANYHLLSNSYKNDLVILPQALVSEQYGIGIRKGCTVTKEKIDAALRTLKSNGNLAKIAEKWNLTQALIVE